jgi:hypothetical protein
MSLLVALNICVSPAFAFESPLPDTAVREAYFLGQRHNETLDRFLSKYTLFPPAPKTGPHIQAISFLTPYALIAQYSGQQASNYSAQQAQIDHRKQAEFVRVIVQIGLTDSYGPARPAAFWKDFRVRVFDEDQFVTPKNAQGEPSLRCDGSAGCVLIGAVIKFELPASEFVGKKALVQVEPPEGQPVVAEFDTSSLQ